MKKQKTIKRVFGIMGIILGVGAMFSYIFAPDGAVWNAVNDFLFGGGAAMAMATVPITGKPATPRTQSVEETLKNEETEGLDVWDVEDQVKVCRPDNAPLDQLIRMEGNARPTRSQRFDFWAATQNDGIYKTSNSTVGGVNSAAMTVADSGIPTAFTIELAQGADDLLVDDVLGCYKTELNGYSWTVKDTIVTKAAPTVPIILQIVEKNSPTSYKAIVVNSKEDTGTVDIKDTTFFRIGNAKNEEDVLNEAYNLMPKKDGNFAQRFMKVVSESDHQAMMEKEANWGLEQFRSASMYAHRLEVELSQFVGQRRHVTPYAGKGDVFYTGGFDDFLKGNIITKNISAAGAHLDLKDIQAWGQRVFANSNGGPERYMFISPLFMQKILEIPQLTTVNNSILSVTDAVDLKGQKLGFSVRKLDTGYGIINLVMHKGLAGRRDYRGYIVDTTNIRRRVHTPAIAKQVDLEDKLIKKAKAIIIEECCGLEIQNIDTMSLVDLIV